MGFSSKYSGVLNYLVKGLLLSIASEVFYHGFLWFYNRRNNKHLKNSLKLKTKTDETICEVVFFPDRGYYCRSFFEDPNGCQDKKCRRVHEQTSFKTILDYIKNAKQSVEICVYIFSSPDLAYHVLELYKKGIKVRLLTDAAQSETAGDSQVGRLRKAGIPVRLHQSVFLMHHKFIIVDQKLIITGSLNWTRQAVLGNHENVLITSERRLVQPFVEEFLQMWNSFDDATQKQFMK